jgi:hypothetical protein
MLFDFTDCVKDSTMLLMLVFALLLQGLTSSPAEEQMTWHLTGLDTIGGVKPVVEGHPQVTAEGIHFNGKDDALFLPEHPLAGAETWTWEMVFRPDADGAEEQRIFHLQSVDGEGKDYPHMRQLFEIRIRQVPGRAEKGWCLDSFATSSDQPGTFRTLLDCSPEKLHGFGDGFHTATATYDGMMLRSYVDGVLQAEGTVKLSPQMPGRTSLGVRINHLYYFKGTIAEARFTRHVLGPGEFLVGRGAMGKSGGG